MCPSYVALRHHRLPLIQDAQQPQLAIFLDSHGAELVGTTKALILFQRDLMEAHRLTLCYNQQ